MRVLGKIALITGSGNLKGIGCGVAECLALEGADIILHGLESTRDETELVAEKIRKMGRKVYMISGDISNHEDVKNMFTKAMEMCGRIDIVVNNAGICIWDNFVEITQESFDKVISVNLKGTIDCSRVAAKIMIENNIKGSIINVASCHARRPFPTMAVYGATKGGIDHFSRSLAFELSQYGIRVNQIWPGLVLTDINNANPAIGSEESKKKHLQTIPLGVIATPHDIGEAVVYFASEESKTVTGEAIKIDGGSFIRCLQ
jgi:3-oxoacyl-[acyl-carrier protein] reductase